MRFLIALCCLSLAAATPSINYPVTRTLVSPVSVSSQYHVQDTLGQYTYGYSAGSSAKAESKTLDGVVRGGYSYLDGNGIVQTASYIADDVNGFRVAATNLPNQVIYDTPEVAAAKAAHSVAYNKVAYAAANAPDVSEAVLVPAAVVSSYVASPPAVSLVKEVPSTAFSYSSVAAPPSVAAASGATSYSLPVSPVVGVVKDVPSKAFSYSTAEATSVAATPSVTTYSVPVSPVVGVVKDVPSKAFSYSTVSSSPSVVLLSSPAAGSYSVATENIPVAPVLDVKQVSAVPYAALVASTSHQYHVQDNLGQYSYGYSGGPSAKVEAKTLDGVTRGQYSYIDGNGIVQSASYVADDVNGFRVAATNIPVGPSSPVVHKVLVSPVIVDNQLVADTPAVVAAKSVPVAARAPVKYGY